MSPIANTRRQPFFNREISVTNVLVHLAIFIIAAAMLTALIYIGIKFYDPNHLMPMRGT